MKCAKVFQRQRAIAAAVAMVTFGGLATGVPAAERPNIVLIFADDLGWRDVGYQSEGRFLTPNIDRLASEGMVFTDGYSAAGNCAPSRACLLSGNYTPRHHVYAVGDTNRGPKAFQRLIPIPNRSGLAPANVTLADALRSAGYATGHFGKWHLAGQEGANPTQQGFDVSFDSFGQGAEQEGAEGNKKGPPEDPKGVYTLTRKACEFIEANRDRPFFCYLPHHAVHSPLQTRPSTRDLFQNQRRPASPRVEYLGCVYDLDDSVGILLRKLKELNLEQNTLVVFTSDNGGTKENTQEPLRGNKGCYYEGGIREPFIVRWPGVVAPGTHCDVPVINVDLFPTFLAAAQARTPDGKTLDGESLLPLLKQNGSLQRKSIFWHFPGYLDTPVTRGRDPVFRTRPISVIRKGNWKLHLYHEEWVLDGGRDQLATNNSLELYNLDEDEGERTNLALTHPEQRDQLLDELLAWMKDTDAKMPQVANAEYDAASKAEAVPRRRRNNP